MERSTTEEITNFWSHFPNGLTFRELSRMPQEERIERAARPAASVAVTAEVMLVSEAVQAAEFYDLQPEVNAA